MIEMDADTRSMADMNHAQPSTYPVLNGST